MRRHLLAVFVACASIAGAAEQALSDGAPYEYAAPTYTPANYGWSGFYLGAHLGGTWGSSTANGETGVTLDDSWSSSPSGVVVGATLGYNWQLGPMIYGIEGDLGNLGMAGSGGYYVPFGYDTSTNTDTDFYLTLRGRLGVLMNGWMLYATGGYLGADTTVSILEACDVFCTTPAVSASNSQLPQRLDDRRRLRSDHRRRVDGKGRVSLLRSRRRERDDAARQRHRRQHLERRDRRQPRARRHQLPVQQLQVGAIAFRRTRGLGVPAPWRLSLGRHGAWRSSGGRPRR